jgi:hypothetical protein
MTDNQKALTSTVPPPPPPPPSSALPRPARKWPKVVASADPQRNKTPDDNEEEEVGLPHDLPAKEIQDALSATRLEHLYDLLPEGMTPRTVFIPLTRATARLIVDAYEAGREAPPGRRRNIQEPLNLYEATLRSEVSPILQKTLDLFGPQGAFVKGPVRSPKDCVMKSGRWEIEYKRLLRAKPEVLAAPLNERMELFFEAAGNALRYRTADELLRAFVLSTRILQDMLIYLQLEDDSEQQNFVFREWEPVPVDAEFRLFVVNGVLTAISEYMFKLYSPRLIAAQNSIRARLATYHAEVIAPALGHLYAKYIVDVTIRDFKGSNELDWRPQVLEVNPLVALEAGFSGEALFADEKGKQILMGPAKDVDYPVIRVQMLPQGIAWMEKAKQNFMTRVEREVAEELEQ